MGYFGNLEKKSKAQNLRKRGYSYSKIQKIINVPKSTLSGWCRDIALTEDQALKLFKNKLKGAQKGRIIGAKRQQQRRIKQTKQLFDEGVDEIGKLSPRDKFLIGLALYSAEGTKTDGQCNFANSDPKLIKFMSFWFRKYCKVKKDKLRGALWIHDNLDKEKAEKYWSKVTGITLSQFFKTYVTKNKIGSKKIRKNVHQYGVFSIRFTDSKIHRKLMGWIAGICV